MNEVLFKKFWDKYPKKKKKAEAKREFITLAINELEFSQLEGFLEESIHSENWQKDNGYYIPYPANWLIKKEWQEYSENKINKEEISHDEPIQCIQ